MDNIILTLHPVTDAARNVLKDPRNANLLVQVDANSKDDAAPLLRARPQRLFSHRIECSRGSK